MPGQGRARSASPCREVTQWVPERSRLKDTPPGERCTEFLPVWPRSPIARVFAYALAVGALAGFLLWYLRREQSRVDEEYQAAAGLARELEDAQAKRVALQDKQEKAAAEVDKLWGRMWDKDTEIRGLKERLKTAKRDLSVVAEETKTLQQVKTLLRDENDKLRAETKAAEQGVRKKEEAVAGVWKQVKHAYEGMQEYTAAQGVLSKELEAEERAESAQTPGHGGTEGGAPAPLAPPPEGPPQKAAQEPSIDSVAKSAALLGLEPLRSLLEHADPEKQPTSGQEGSAPHGSADVEAPPSGDTAADQRPSNHSESALGQQPTGARSDSTAGLPAREEYASSPPRQVETAAADQDETRPQELGSHLGRHPGEVGRALERASESAESSRQIARPEEYPARGYLGGPYMIQAPLRQADQPISRGGTPGLRGWGGVLDAR